MILNKFHALPSFSATQVVHWPDVACNAAAFSAVYAGVSFGRGGYRVLRVEECVSWSRLAERFFAKRDRQYQCFAQDWLGRLYVEDADDGLVKLACHITDDVLSTGADVCEFHNKLLPENYSEILDLSLLDILLNRDDECGIENDRVYSLIQPLNLGGTFDVENFELGYALVDWDFSLQVKQQL